MVRSLKDAGINPTLFWAYRTSKEESDNDLIDFNGAIWDYDIKEIADCLRAEGITEFTISSTFSGLIETLAAFEKERHLHERTYNSERKTYRLANRRTR